MPPQPAQYPQQPTMQQKPRNKLVPKAALGFHLSLWLGLVILVSASIFALMGLASGGYGLEAEILRITRLGTAGTLLSWAAPFLASAIVVSALGQRQTVHA